MWRIKRLGGEYTIKWSKEESHPSYKPESKTCSLCQNEKLKIASYNGKNLLNQRNEIISRCRHRLKFKLKKLIFWRQILDLYVRSEPMTLLIYNGFSWRNISLLMIARGTTVRETQCSETKLLFLSTIGISLCISRWALYVHEYTRTRYTYIHT